jgi:hypothetical protein
MNPGGAGTAPAAHTIRPMDFPHWFQPRRDVGAILVASQAELDALIASGWPDVQCPDPTAPLAVAPVAEPTKRRRAASAES